jgi:hypothetical protein
MKTIHRTSSVAMKLSAINSKGDQVSERKVFSSKLTLRVSHDLSFLCEGWEYSCIAAGMHYLSCHSTAEQEAVATWPSRYTHPKGDTTVVSLAKAQALMELKRQLSLSKWPGRYRFPFCG